MRKALLRAGVARPAVTIVSYCALRPRVLGEAARAEIPAMVPAAGGSPLVGFCSFGEQALSDVGVPEHTNVVIGALAIGDELSQPAIVARENEALRRQADELHRRQERELERLVAERTAQLSAANASLQAEVAERARVTERLEAERHDLARMMTLFAQGEARTRAIVESAHDGIVLLGRDGRIEGLNRAAERIFRWSRAEAAGLPFLDELIAPRSRSDLARRIGPREGEERAPQAPRRVRGLRRGGEEFPIECTVTVLEPLSSGRRCAFVRDLTEELRGGAEPG